MKIRHFSLVRWLDNEIFAAWFLLTPAIILLGLFIIWPITYLFYLSFTSGSFTQAGIHWVGLKNYWRLFLTRIFGKLYLIRFISLLGVLYPV